MAGQIIGKEEIKIALRSGKLQDLLDLATVSLLGDQENAAAVVDEEEPEIEVEEVVTEPEEDASTACVTEEAEEDADKDHRCGGAPDSIEFPSGNRNYQICIVFDSISDRWLRYFEESMEGNLKPSGI